MRDLNTKDNIEELTEIDSINLVLKASSAISEIFNDSQCLRALFCPVGVMKAAFSSSTCYYFEDGDFKFMASSLARDTLIRRVLERKMEMDGLIKKIQEVEREARRLKKEDSRDKYSSQTQPVSNWTLPRERLEHPSPPRPSASRSLKSLGNGFQSSSLPTCVADPKEPFEGDGDGDWWNAFKNEAGSWTGEKLVVLSLFDGIGGIWAALTRLGIPFVGYSSEVCAPAVQVVKAKFPGVHHLGDVRNLERSAIAEEVDLLVGGFPCQDLSCMGKKEGLHGPRSKLFFDLLAVLQSFSPKWFLVENVASMTWIDRDEISKYLRVLPFELDSIELTPSKRRRLYWTNIPLPPRLPRVRDHPSTFVQSCLHNAIALEEKTGVILGYTADSANSCTLEQVLEAESNELRKVTQMEVEQILGYPPDHTNVMVQEAYNNYYARLKITDGVESCTVMKSGRGGRGGRRGRGGRSARGSYYRRVSSSKMQEPLKAAVRWMLLGNTFSVPAIAYIVSPLLRNSIRTLGQPIYISGPVIEKDCSVMEPDDVWAMYNEHERPNWYALITRRSGDRFCKIHNVAGKKPPLYIEMQYLEITTLYLEGEDDEWNPLRGTGLYEIRQAVDIQGVKIMHPAQSGPFPSNERIASTSKDKIFIFPGKDEVWTVYSRQTWSPFFVYVIESSINIDSMESASPGFEDFHARCHLIIKTGEHETYRRTDKILEFNDLSVFCFRAPYHFKQEANLLRVEVGTKGRKIRKIETMIRRSKRKRGKSGDSLSDEDDDVDVDGEEAMLAEEEEEEEVDGLGKEVEELIDEVEAKREVESKGRVADTDDYAEDFVPDGPDDDVDEEGDAGNGTYMPETIVIDDD